MQSTDSDGWGHEPLAVGDVIEVRDRGRRLPLPFIYRVFLVTGVSDQPYYLEILDTSTGVWLHGPRVWTDWHEWRKALPPLVPYDQPEKWLEEKYAKRNVQPFKAAVPVAPPGGMCCKSCRCLNPDAGPNRPDGSYICYECR